MIRKVSQQNLVNLWYKYKASHSYSTQDFFGKHVVEKNVDYHGTLKRVLKYSGSQMFNSSAPVALGYDGFLYLTLLENRWTAEQGAALFKNFRLLRDVGLASGK